MATRVITYGDLTGLLLELGFTPKPLDEHHVVYLETGGDGMFVLPNRPPETRADVAHVSIVRRHLDLRGRFEKDDFDARFATPRTRAKR